MIQKNNTQKLQLRLVLISIMLINYSISVVNLLNNQNTIQSEKKVNANSIDSFKSNASQQNDINDTDNSQLILKDDDTIIGGNVSKILYEGIWTSKNDSQNDFVKSNTGKSLAMVTFVKKNTVTVIFEIYQTEYIDKPHMISSLELELTNKDQSVFSVSGNNTLRQINSLFSSSDSVDCDLDIEFTLVNKNTDKPMPITSNDTSVAKLTGKIFSKVCNLDFTFTSTMARPELIKALIFTLLQVILICWGISPLYKMLKRNNMNQILILSEWTFIFNIMMDLILVVINLTFSMKILTEYFEFLTVVTMFFMFSVLFKIRFFLYANEIRSANSRVTGAQLTRKKFLFMLKFVGLCIIAVACGDFLIEFEFIFYIFFAYPLFQIFFNFSNVTQKNCFLWELHPALILSQVFFPVFMKGTSLSFFKITPVTHFPYILVGEILLLMMILFFQKSFGACFFLPKCMIPNYFSYFKKFSSSPVDAEENCPICFSLLTESPDYSEGDSEDDKEAPLVPKKYMQTPCAHNFHEKCLKSWMEHKLICPCCRMSIPPVI